MPKETYIIQPDKKVAPMFLSLVVAITYIIMSITLIYAIMTREWFWLLCPVLLALFDFVLSKVFAWYTQEEVIIREKEVEVRVHTNVNVLGTDFTSYKLVFGEITAFNVQAGKITFKGNISRKEPKMKPKSIKKFVLYDVTETVENRLKELFHA